MHRNAMLLRFREKKMASELIHMNWIITSTSNTEWLIVVWWCPKNNYGITSHLETALCFFVLRRSLKSLKEKMHGCSQTSHENCMIILLESNDCMIISSSCGQQTVDSYSANETERSQPMKDKQNPELRKLFWRRLFVCYVNAQIWCDTRTISICSPPSTSCADTLYLSAVVFYQYMLYFALDSLLLLSLWHKQKQYLSWGEGCTGFN
jgi:hypothetical protein